MERYVRGNGKWVKITRLKRGLYFVAFGYEGAIASITSRSKKTPTLMLANAYAASWIND
jgi:hypothetical protein